MADKSMLDINGQILKIGDKVEIIIITDSFIKSLDTEALKILRPKLAKQMPVVDIDNHFVWLEVVVYKSETNYESHLFGLEPDCLLKHV